MSNERYRHTQPGWVIVVAAIGVIAVGVLLVATGAPLAAGVICTAVGAIQLVTFGALTVTVDETRVGLRFGVGLIRKSYALDSIRAVRPVTDPWWVGTGVRMIKGGWLYSVDGRQAVELELEDGKRVHVGTDEPAALATAVAAACGHGDLPPSVETSGFGTRWPRIAVALVFPLVFASIAYQARIPHVDLTRERVLIRSGFYTTVLPTKEITDVQVVDSAPVIERKTNGFSLGRTLRGRFVVKGFGEGDCYLEMGHGPYVIIRTKSAFVILSYKDDEYTRLLIEGLRRISAA